MGVVLSLDGAVRWREQAKSGAELVVFTNGCFDLLHAGHVEYLERAAAMGDHLMVAVNSDRSVRAIKGPERPVVVEGERCKIVASLQCVDVVVLFDELTPERLISVVAPDVLVKGGDWRKEDIVGGALVESWGGRVESIASSVPDRSSTQLIDLARSAAPGSACAETPDGVAQLMRNYLRRSAWVMTESEERLSDGIVRAGEMLVSVFRSGDKVFLCGNGGSALAAQHVAAELVGRFRDDRLALPAIALATDAGVVTAVANDYGYEEVFARQVRALAQPGDLLLAFSTSGNSRNVIRAVEAARSGCVTTVGLTGSSGGRLADLADIALRVPSDSVSHIQEVHLALGHVLCEFVESRLRDHVTEDEFAERRMQLEG